MPDKYEWPISDSESVEFDIHDLDVSHLNASVVFIFACQTDDGWLPLYVGEVESARERLSNHPLAAVAVRSGATHLHMKGMTSPSGRKRLANALIEHHQPSINLALRESGFSD